MALDILKTVDVIEAMENFLARKRPPEHIRPKLDLGYQINQQSIIINEIRPQWNKPEIIREFGVAKATYVKSKNYWKVFWKRADLQWHSYTPRPTVTTIAEFTHIVEEDRHHCFWG